MNEPRDSEFHDGFLKGVWVIERGRVVVSEVNAGRAEKKQVFSVAVN